MGLIRRLQKRDEEREAETDLKDEARPLRPTTRLFRKWDAPVQPDPKPEPEPQPAETGGERGTTLLEMMIVVAIIGCLAVGLFKLFASANSLFRAGDAKADIEEQGRVAAMSIANELRQSGYYTDPVTLKSYPYIFADGAAQSPFSAHSHTPAQHHAEAGTSAYGPSHEIVFRITADLDGDGVRTASATGDIEWNASEISYVLVTAADGVNQVERRVNGGSPKIVARYVERMCFDDNATDSSVSYGQIRLTLYMRKTTTDGRVVKASYSTIVKMRNYEG
jgi:prepilin-type N-terminal cleavage/methylation domain-containing protein